MVLLDLCSADDVAPGIAIRVDSGDLQLAVYNIDGDYFVTDDICTHGRASLSDGYIEGDVVECSLHSGKFNIKTGAVVSLPCTEPIKTYKTTVENGRVLIYKE